MKRIRTLLFVLVLVSFIFSPVLNAQTVATEGTHFDMTGFPQWARDLRRASIIAFGVFPFAYFFASFGHDSYRFASNEWDRRFAPWPLNSAGTVEKTHEEHIATIGLAAVTAIIISVIDHGIMRSRRNRLERENRDLPEGIPIIIRRPIYDDDTDTYDPELSNDEIPDELLPESN